MAKLTGIGSARSRSGGGSWFVPGRFRVRIERVTSRETRNGEDMVAVEAEILSSTADELPVGARASQVFVLSANKEKRDMTLTDLAEFMKVGLTALAINNGAANTTPETVIFNDDIAEEVCGLDNLLAGIVLDVVAFNKLTRAGGDFTRVTWELPSVHAATANNAQAELPF